MRRLDDGKKGEGDSPKLGDMDEEIVMNSVPLAQFNANQLSSKDKTVKEDIDLNALSPSAAQAVKHVDFQSIDHPSLLQKATGATTSKPTLGTIERYCACGLPIMKGSDVCEQCAGTKSIHIEGEILKKQKKGGKLKGYWFVLLGKELYCKLYS